VNGGQLRLLPAAADGDPVERLWRQLPALWRGPVIGPGIKDWAQYTENGWHRIDLTGLPDPLAMELAWMAHWQAGDGTRCSVLALNQMASIVRFAIAEHHPFPGSMLQMDWDTAAALQGWYLANRWGRLPQPNTRRRLWVIFRFARLALLSRCADGPWWALDEWRPRCDPRIPLSPREPRAHYGCSPGQITQRWLRDAVKWHLGTMLESGALRWSTVIHDRMQAMARLDRWLTSCSGNPRDVLGDPAAAPGQAAAFARWTADPANRASGSLQRATIVDPRSVNDDLRAVAGLFGFVAASPAETRRVLGPSPWDKVTEAHAASWHRQVRRIPRQPLRTDHYYVDDHAFSQILATLPLLGLPAVSRCSSPAATAPR
jgi:hypothetical protein